MDAGYYTLLVYLYDGTTFKWGAAEAVRIIKEQTSEGAYAIIPGSGDIGDINLIITPDLQNPIGITFSGETENLKVGTNMTITATTSEPVETYQWYLNGKPLTGETSATITIGSALPKGNYRLDLLVSKRMIISSGTVKFAVTDNSATPTPTSTVTATPTPTPLPSVTVTPTVTNISSIVIPMVEGGYNHSIALKSDGTVWTWGLNNLGQLGNGTYQNSLSPVQVYGLNNVKRIAAGGNLSLALKNDGTVWAWGSNACGLGNGGTGSYTIVQVTGLANVKDIVVGNDYWTGNHRTYSLALKQDGTVWAWGFNEYGQLGDGTYNTRTTPVQVNDLSGVTDISACYFHSLALKSDGTVWAWGYNSYGELGDGIIHYQTFPGSSNPAKQCRSYFRRTSIQSSPEKRRVSLGLGI